MIQGNGGTNTMYFPGATGTVTIVWSDSISGTATDGLGGTDTFYCIHHVIMPSDSGSPAPSTHDCGLTTDDPWPSTDALWPKTGQLLPRINDSWPATDDSSTKDDSLSQNSEGNSTTTDLVPVYRFWSPVLSKHFYTINAPERDKLINNYSHVWSYEGIAYHAFSDAIQPGVLPVYRFWSGSSHFYTTNLVEKTKLIANYSSVWTYEGIAFYAHADSTWATQVLAVYRFWSPVLNGHFFTMSQTERDKLLNLYSNVWTYEGIAWYGYQT